VSEFEMVQVFGDVRRSIPVEEVVASTTTAYQKVALSRSRYFGTVLTIDGLAQSSDLDGYIYHEILVHPVMAAHPAPKSVLILGGGECATAKEVLRDRNVEQVTMVDIDPELVTFVRKHWPTSGEGVFDDDRFELVASDSRAFLETTSKRFDVIIFDLTDPIPNGPAERLYTVESFELARRCLSADGVVAIQGDWAELGRSAGHLAIMRTLGQVFRQVSSCYAPIPLFGGLYGFAIASNGKLTMDPAVVAATLSARGVTELKYVDEETLRGAFAVPRYIREELHSGRVDLSTDANPHHFVDGSVNR
jgi:spermidine synthase